MINVTVVIPCYNQAHYLTYAVNSVLAQSVADWEAIIVNDGSTDDTREVATQFVDARIRYIHQDNQGLSAARNSGIQAARGKYLAFLDADDAWEPDFISRCVELLDRDTLLGFVYTRNYFINPQGQKLPQLGGQALSERQFRSRVVRGGFFPVHAALIRRQALESVGAFDITLTSVEDWDLWMRISEHYPIKGIDEPLVHYRVYPGSMSTDAERMHRNRLKVLDKHFGPPEGRATSWPAEKRQGYAFAYRATAVDYIAHQRTDAGWSMLAQAVEIEPRILERLDTLYELALGDQPRGYRGEARLLELEVRNAGILAKLDTLFASASRPVQAKRGQAYANAYLALAMLSDQAGDWSTARGYLLKAIWHSPNLLSGSLIRRLAKLAAGRRIVSLLKKLLGSHASAADSRPENVH